MIYLSFKTLLALSNSTKAETIQWMMKEVVYFWAKKMTQLRLKFSNLLFRALIPCLSSNLLLEASIYIEAYFKLKIQTKRRYLRMLRKEKATGAGMKLIMSINNLVLVRLKMMIFHLMTYNEH